MVLASDVNVQGDTVEFIHWLPEIAIYSLDALGHEGIEVLLENARRSSQKFLRLTGDCSEDFSGFIERLDGDGQQSAIDDLFASLPLAAEEVKCLANPIQSKNGLTERSFRPPYSSWEGVFHHGYPTRGDLVAYLLPHLTGMELYPITLPLSDRQRLQLADAWAYWASVEFGVCGDQQPLPRLPEAAG